MDVQSAATGAPARAAKTSGIARVDVEGIVAGILGAATIAIWFFLIDVIDGRPFYTANLLGNALFHPATAFDPTETPPISLETVLMFTEVHGLLFCVIGAVAAKLLAMAERNENLGFGILLFLVFFEFGFVAVAFIFAEPILHELTWPAVLLGNFFAAAVMGLYFCRRHANLSILP